MILAIPFSGMILGSVGVIHGLEDKMIGVLA